MHTITFRQLQVFVDAVDAGSFRLCAERLGISQVSISDHIHTLENQTGTTLFKRQRGASARVTEDGRRAYERAVAVLAEADAFFDALRPKQQKNRRRKLVVGAPSYVSYRLSNALADFGLQHPELQIEIEAYDHDSLLEGLAQGHVDVGIFLTLDGIAPADSTLLWREPLGLYIGAQHPLANKDCIAPEELRAFPFIYLPERSQLRGLIDIVLSRIGVSGCPVALQTENAALAQRSIVQGHGFGCLFANAAEKYVVRGDLHLLPLSVALPTLEVRLLVRPARRGYSSVRQLTAFLEHACFTQKRTLTF